MCQSICRYNLRHVESFENCFTTFVDDGDACGKSSKVVNQENIQRWWKNMASVVKAELCVIQSTGEFILWRQYNMLQMLKILVVNIIENEPSASRLKKHRKVPKDVGRAALEILLSHRWKHLHQGLVDWCTRSKAFSGSALATIPIWPSLSTLADPSRQ